MRKVLVAVSSSFLLIGISGLANEPAPSPTPVGGKNVRTQVENPKHAKPVGVQATDPSRNGEVNTSGDLSLKNTSSMGVGVKFDLTRPKKVAPKKANKDAEESE